jgi:GH35 family endo-1,4-beta-xylanase
VDVKIFEAFSDYRYIEEDKNMRATAKKIDPEDYILSVLSPEDRLDAAFKVAREAFRKTKLTMRDIDKAVDSVRRKTYGKEKKGSY